MPQPSPPPRCRENKIITALEFILPQTGQIFPGSCSKPQPSLAGFESRLKAVLSLPCQQRPSSPILQLLLPGAESGPDRAIPQRLHCHGSLQHSSDRSSEPELEPTSCKQMPPAPCECFKKSQAWCCYLPYSCSVCLCGTLLLLPCTVAVGRSPIFPPAGCG